METPSKEIREFAKKAKPILKQYGYLRNGKNLLWVVLAFVLGTTFSGVLFYGIQTDAFKSIVNQEVEIEPIVNISNDYDFAPLTSNNYGFYPNYTIINNIFCP